jgi:YD repeat-containing protein
LTSVDGVAYTWDARGNLTNDGTFTYTYNAAGRLVQAESVTSTLVYTYTAGGLRVGQSVDGDEATYAWDWASGPSAGSGRVLPEMLSEGGNSYLVGHETLGQWNGDEWAYYLPDGLGSVRQVTDETGAVVSAREWTPYGVEVGSTQAGLGYTGEWSDAALGMTYLRARWYDSYLKPVRQSRPYCTRLSKSAKYQRLYVCSRESDQIY